MFALQNAPMPALELAGLTLTLLEVDSGMVKFDLTLNLEERPEGLCGAFEYNTDLFDAATITRLARHFQALIEGIAAEPGLRIADVPILSTAEQRQLLVEWNDTLRGVG